MKRVVIFIAFMLIGFISCDPAEWLHGSDEKWFFKNGTDIVLTISHSDMETQSVSPGDSVCILRKEKLEGNGAPVFEDFSPIDSILVVTADGISVSEWIRSKADEYERNIYSESEWVCHISEVNGPDDYCWTFTFDDADYTPPQINFEESLKYIVSRIYDYNGNLTATYEYNDQWQILSMVHYDYNSIPGTVRSMTFRFSYISDTEFKVEKRTSQADMKIYDCDYYYMEDKATGNIELKSDLFNQGLILSEIFIIDDDGNINKEIGDGVLQFIYDDNRNITGLRRWKDPNMGDIVIGETEYGLDLVEYNNIYQYDQNPRPNFGMGKCFFIEPRPYFGGFGYERALSQNNMTHVHGEVNWEYTYNEIGLPTMINVIWPGVELLTPIVYKIEYVYIE